MKSTARITILIIGSEIVSGKTLDTNSQFITRTLGRCGFAVRKIVAIKDDLSEIIAALAKEFRENNVIITTGGLGPTFDDLTIPAIARFFNVPLVFHRDAFKSICAYFKGKQKLLTLDRKRQAFLPRGCRIIENRKGVVPGIIMHQGGKHLIAVPGVPYEMEAMCAVTVPAYLRRKFVPLIQRETCINTAGISESSLERKIRRFVQNGPQGLSIEHGIYPRCGEVQFKISIVGSNKNIVERTLCRERKKFSRVMRPYVYGYDDETLPEILVKRLYAGKATFSVAESCTGGLIAKAITDVAGASRVFRGGYIVYSNQSKIELLDVPAEMIKGHGAVSPSVARVMAKNVRIKFGVDYAIAVTGIAGPGGGSKAKPVGLVYIAVASRRSVHVQKHEFFGARDAVRTKTMKHALFRLLQEVY